MSTTINAPSHYGNVAQLALAQAKLDSLQLGCVSPDMILQYVASRLRDTDGQMQGLMKKQRDMEAQGKMLSELTDELAADGEQDFTQGDAASHLMHKYQELIDRAGGPTTELGAKLAAARDGLQASFNTDGTFSSDEMHNALDAVSRIQSSLSQGGEMLMMKLQSLASGRQQILQAASNLMGSLSETNKALAGNIGK